MTGADGGYAFTSLPDGAYRVQVNDAFGILAGYTPTLIVGGTADNTNKAQPYSVMLAAGNRINMTADFGYFLPDGAIGDYVWYDTNDNDLQNVGEPGIGNVTIALVKDSGNGSPDPTDVVVATTTTDANGGYIFTGLPAGTYFVDVTDTKGVLAGYKASSTGPESQTSPFKVVLTTGQVVLNADFGYVQLTNGKAVVGDTVWWDNNQNGVRDPSELGIPNTPVALVRVSDGVTIANTTTDENGNYLFTNVNPGTYRVDVTTPPPSSTPSAAAPDPTAPFTVVANQQYLDADIGFVPTQPATIGGTVWNDTTPNGVLAGEPGIPGVTVDLLTPAGVIIATTTTDTNGNYTFIVPPGSYLVQVSDTHNVLDDFTDGPLGPNPGQDNNNQAQPYPITIGGGDSNTTADFGYVQNETPAGVIGNQVWFETDRDGIYEPLSGEVGVAGVTVELLDSQNNFIARTMTGADGGYAFTSLADGTYKVKVTDTFGILTGYAPTTIVGGAADNTNKAQPYSVTLAAGSRINMTADFGYTLPGGAIGDYVWYDANKNGLQDVGEPGIGNVTIDLRDPSNKLIATTTTDANGGYIFTDLPAGTYIVDVTDTKGVLFGYSSSPTGVGSESQTDPFQVVLAAAQVVNNADFGYYQPTNGGTAVVGDTVWWDTNGNGERDPSELGIPGVLVLLLESGTNQFKGSTTTDENGNYLFNNVAPGTYYVDAATPPLNSTPSPGAPDPTAAFTVLANQQYLDADIGFLPTQPATIGGTVWNDTTPNGVLAGEPGIPGVTVDLLTPAGVIIATTTTDTNGNYTFIVPPGSYLVQVSDTHNVLDDFTGGPLGPNPGQDNNNQAQPYPITIGGGNSNTTADFGYVQYLTPAGVIGNQVWFEADRDGIYEPLSGEVGVAGVTVELLDSQNNFIARTMTGADGGYAFTSLADGTYKVKVTDTFGILTGYAPTTIVGGTADNTNKAQPYSVTLAAGSRINMTADFGYILPGGAIGDYVWYDANKNGLQDVGEPGIGNVTIDLRDPSNKLIATTTTDANGGYIFTDLLAGTYIVDVTDTKGVLFGYSPSPTGVGSESQTDPFQVVLAAAQVVNNADFGYYQPTNGGTAVVGDTVWWDTNGNGERDPSELGIPGVVVLLLESGTNQFKGSTTTDENGNYLFNNVAPGTYYVDAATPPLNSTPSPGAPDPTAAFTVLANQQYLDADIGFLPTQPATIGGTVWNDTTPNGVLAGEPGIPGVTVDLLTPAGVIIATTTTDTNGNYTFIVPPGSYLVQVSDTHNVLDDFTGGPLGPNPGQDNNNQAQPYPITIGGGNSNTTADFGYVQYLTPAGVIGNQVWFEADHDGVYEPLNGEIGVAGVTVQLLDSQNNPLATTMTGADGGYAFTSLADGTYKVKVTDTFGILTGYPPTSVGATRGQQQPGAAVQRDAGGGQPAST